MTETERRACRLAYALERHAAYTSSLEELSHSLDYVQADLERDIEALAIVADRLQEEAV